LTAGNSAVRLNGARGNDLSLSIRRQVHVAVAD